VASSPVVMTGRLKNVADGSESVQLTWQRDQRWQSQIVGRETVAQAGQLVQLARLGLPVNSGNATAVVQFLADYEAINLPVLPCARVSARLGWQDPEGRLGFLLGQTFITPTGEQVEATLPPDMMAPSAGGDHRIVFQGADGGDDQFVQGFHAAGTYNAWLRTVQRVVPYPRALLAIYAALTPPLLMVLKAPNFCLDWCGPTSQGKTTVLQLAASCWGCPDERLDATVLKTWDVTRVWVEQASTVLHALPLMLDDTKRARDPEFVAQVLYDVTSGQGRGRGSIQGMRRGGAWGTVLLSSGEAPATSFTQDGGTRARVVTLWGSPFGKADTTTAAVVDALRQGLVQHYGHLGPRFVQELMKVRAEWNILRKSYADIHQGYQQRGEGNPVIGRMAAYFAALRVTEFYAHEFLKLPWDFQDLINGLWDDLITEASEADRAAHALASIMSWAHGNQQAFWGRHQVDRDHHPKVPSQGWAGQWTYDDAWHFIAFFPHRLNELLRNLGFEPEAVIRTWRDRKWLITGSDRSRNHTQVRMDKGKPWMVAIKRQAVTEAESK
jgi:putative DNA primase/helicase